MMRDLRGFKYPLEPLLKRQCWRLEALLTELGVAERAHKELSGVLEELEGEYHAQSHDALLAITKKCDPAASRRRLVWLVHLRSRILEVERRLEQISTEKRAIQARYRTHQQRFDVFNKHRESAANAYLRVEAARVLKVSDQDWLMRRPSSRRIASRRTSMRSDGIGETGGIFHG